MPASRRTWKAWFVEPFKQLRFGFQVIGVCFGYLTLLSVIFVTSFSSQYEQVKEIFGVANMNDLMDNKVFWYNAFYISMVMLCFAASILVVVFRRTHKMYGPMVSIKRFVSELDRGNYAVRLTVRDGDDFQELVNTLNVLAANLHKKHGVLTAKDKTSDMDELARRVNDMEDGLVEVDNPEDNSYNKAS